MFVDPAFGMCHRIHVSARGFVRPPVPSCQYVGPSVRFANIRKCSSLPTFSDQFSHHSRQPSPTKPLTLLADCYSMLIAFGIPPPSVSQFPGDSVWICYLVRDCVSFGPSFRVNKQRPRNQTGCKQVLSGVTI